MSALFVSPQILLLCIAFIAPVNVALIALLVVLGLPVLAKRLWMLVNFCTVVHTTCIHFAVVLFVVTSDPQLVMCLHCNNMKLPRCDTEGRVEELLTSVAAAVRSGPSTVAPCTHMLAIYAQFKVELSPKIGLNCCLESKLAAWSQFEILCPGSPVW
jgi:hypothetical protein